MRRGWPVYWSTVTTADAPVVTPPEIHLQCEVLRLTALLGELRLILEAFDPGDVCLREWDAAHACPCRLCAAKRVIRYSGI